MNDALVNLLNRENDLMFEAFRKESDRGAALVAGAFFDATLERLLRARFSHHSDRKTRFTDPLFDVFGPLSTFSSKIRVSYAIDLLQDWLACDLDLIRRIRNEFSHSLESRTFRDSDIAGMVDQLSAPAKIKFDFGSVPEPLRTRSKFDLACSRIGALLQAKVVVQESDGPEEMKRSFMITPDL